MCNEYAMRGRKENEYKRRKKMEGGGNMAQVTRKNSIT